MTLPIGCTEAEQRYWLRLTRVCNQRCLFCHDRDNQDGSMATWEDIERELAEGRSRGLRRVVLSGGEPTVHPRYLDVVALARTLGYEHVQTITNGRRFCYPDFLDAAVAAGLREATFSLHGHIPAIHDVLTRVPNSFVQAIAAIRRALAIPGLIVSVDVVINSMNLPILREHLEFCLQLGVREFDLLALVPFSDAWRNRDELFCDFTDPNARMHLRRALELSRRPEVRMWTNRLRAEHLEGFESLIQPPEKIFDEVGGRRALFQERLSGAAMPCAGQACDYCFLRDFCRDIDELLGKGKLAPRTGPLCRQELSPKPEPFRFGEEKNIDDFASFYVRSRFFAKGSACMVCADAARCDGISVTGARHRSFSVLMPRAEARSGAEPLYER